MLDTLLNTASNGKSDKALLLETIFEFLNSFVVVHIILWKNHHPIVNQKERKESETAMILFNRNMSWLFGLPIHFSLFSSFCSPRGNFDDLNIAPCGYLKIKSIIYPPTQRLRLPYLAGCWQTARSSHL